MTWDRKTRAAQSNCSFHVGSFCCGRGSVSQSCRAISLSTTNCPEHTHVLDLVLVEGGYGVNYDPGQTATKVDDLVHHEGHDAGGEGVILHVQIPRGPEALCDAKLDMDLGHLLEDGEVVGWCCRVQPTGDSGVDGRERRAPVEALNVSPVRAFGVSKRRDAYTTVAIVKVFSSARESSREEGKMWFGPGQVKKGHCRVRGAVGVVCVLNNPELVEASRTVREITYRFCQGRFIIWGSRDPCELATELELAGVEGGSANGDPLNLRMSRWARVRFRLPSSTSPRNIHPGAASGVPLAPSTAWHLQIGTNLGPMIGSGKSCLAPPKGLLHATTFR